MQRFIFNPRKGEQAPSQDMQYRMAGAIQPYDFGSGISDVARALAYRREKMGSFPVVEGGNSLLGGPAEPVRHELPGKGGLY